MRRAILIYLTGVAGALTFGPSYQFTSWAMAQPTIERIETRLVDLPTIRPHKLSVGTMHGQTLMLVTIYCSDGSVGTGEGATIAGMAYGPESPESMKLAIDAYLGPAMIGKDASRVQ